MRKVELPFQKKSKKRNAEPVGASIRSREDSAEKNGNNRSLLEKSLATIGIQKGKDGKLHKTQTLSSREFTQDLVGVRDIKGGMIITRDGRYIMVMDVLASTFTQMKVSERNALLNQFQRVFKILPIRIQFKTVTERANVNAMIDYIKGQSAKHKMSDRVAIALDDYVDSLTSYKGYGTIKKYYIIFQYEGAAIETGSMPFEEIQSAMRRIYSGVARVLERMGNPVMRHNNEDMFLLELLYKHFNRNTAMTEPYEKRYTRVIMDREKYYHSLGKPAPEMDICDFIAPRGIDFKNNTDFFEMDGVYYTFLTLTADGFPSSVVAGWLTYLFDQGFGVDTDVFLERLPQNLTKYKIQKITSLKRISANEHSGDRMKLQELSGEISNNETLLNMMNAGDDVYNCNVIVTIWGKDPQEILKLRNGLQTDLTSHYLDSDVSHYDCYDYFKMTRPLLDLQKNLFHRNARNITTSSLPSLYNMTAFQLFDEKGYAMGVNMETQSIISINNYNTGMFKNGNMVIIGTSGAGKTFTEMYLGRRQYLSGYGTYYILPTKGNEYEMACLSLDGTFIRLIPGSKDCINIMELRDESKYSNDDADDDDSDAMQEQTQSILSKKVASLTVWVQLLLTKGDAPFSSGELNRFNALAYRVYEKFGINDDNRSIYDADGKPKVMPIISDLYNELRADGSIDRIAEALLPFVSGNCQNLNQQTNVNLNNRCIVFDVDETYIGSENMLSALLYIAFDCACGIAKSTQKRFDTIILDEVWKMLRTEASAEQVQKLVKLIRGYSGSVVLATQEIEDFLKSAGGFGRSVINNTQIKFVMELKPEEAEMLRDVMRLNESDIEILTGFERGNGMLIANGMKVNIDVRATDMEIYLYTTDENVRQKYTAMFQDEVRQGILPYKKNGAVGFYEPS